MIAKQDRRLLLWRLTKRSRLSTGRSPLVHQIALLKPDGALAKILHRLLPLRPVSHHEIADAAEEGAFVFAAAGTNGVGEDATRESRKRQ